MIRPRAGLRAAALLLAAALPVLPVAPHPGVGEAAAAQPGTVLVGESFTGATVSDPQLIGVGTACLTGATASTASVKSCPSTQKGPVPTRGATPGYMQLTDTNTYAGGAVLLNRPVPASKGLRVSFDAHMYGGTGADGMSFFLVDGSTQLTSVGGRGGSLSYAPLLTTPGLLGGYIGVGMDTFGNYYRDNEGKGAGCPAGQRSAATTLAPNVITVRGPGAGTSGYCVLAATVTGDPAKPSSTLPGKLGASGIGTSRRTVTVVITPGTSPRLTLTVDFGSGPRTVLQDVALPAAPATYKMGLAASTGGSTNVHLVRNLSAQTIEPLGELELTKQISRRSGALPAVIRPGTAIPYEYVLTNAGDTTLTAPEITDPATDAPVSCPSGTLPPAPDPGARIVCTGQHTVTAADAEADEVSNTARASATVQGGGTVTSANASLTIPLTSTMTVAKTVTTPAPYTADQRLSYAYTVRNTGGSALSSLRVTDTRSGGAAVVCDANSLPPGASTDCSAQAPVRVADLSPDGHLRSTVTATAATDIGQSVTATSSTATPVAADLAVAITADDPAPAVGDDVTFTIALSNRGPSDVRNVTVGAPTPASATTRSSQAGTGTFSGGTWTVPALAAGATTWLTRTDRITAAGSVTASATVTAAAQPDLTAANNGASTTVSAAEPTADIAVHAASARERLRVGQTTVLTLTARNGGPRATTGVRIRAPLPDALAHVSESGDGTYDPATGLWTAGDLASGETAETELTVRAVGDGFALTTASLAATGVRDPVADNDVATAGVTVEPRSADLAVAVTLSAPDGVRVGDELTATVDADNAGPDDAPGAQVTIDLPPGLLPQDISVEQGSLDLETGVWDIGTLPAGDSVRLTARLVAAEEGFWSGRVSIAAPGVADPQALNSSSTRTVQVQAVPPPETDIAITAAHPDDLTTTTGGTVTYRVRAFNEGPVDASGLAYTTTLPDGFRLESATPSAGSYDPATGRWTLAALADGAAETLELRLRADAGPGGHLVTTALTGIDQTDPDDQDNITSSAVTIRATADLAVTKTVDPPTVPFGGLLTYTVTITNNGPQDDTGVQLQETSRLPPQFLTVEPTQGTFHTDTRTWDVGDLADGASATIVVKIPNRFTWGDITNTTVVSGALVPDPDLTDNQASATSTILAADLAVELATDEARPGRGEDTEVEATVTNRSPHTATGAALLHTLPGGEILSGETRDGSYDAASRTWTPGDTARMTLRVRPASGPDPVTLTTEVTAQNPPDPAPDGTATVTLTPKRTDLTLSAEVGRDSVEQGPGPASPSPSATTAPTPSTAP